MTQTIILITKSFDAKTHVQRDKTCKLMARNGWKGIIFSEHDTTLLDSIPNVVPNCMEEHSTKDGVFDLDYMLYRHVKEMIYNNTTYFICIEDSIVR